MSRHLRQCFDIFDNEILPKGDDAVDDAGDDAGGDKDDGDEGDEDSDVRG